MLSHIIMDHLAPSSGVNWYTSYNAFGELLAATPQLPPMELGGVDVGRPYNTQAYMHYSTQGGGLHYGQETLNDPGVMEEYVCQEKTQIPAQSKAFSQAKVPVGEKIACQECGATFACTANLRNHMRIHTGERPFVCEECGASFTQRSNMRSHKRVHTGERPYMCGICGQTFARSSHLPGHMRTHTGEKPFNCPHCGRSFATNQIMKNHMRTHTGERPFVCDVCSATFAQSSCLATHKKIHTGERNFKCGKCGKAFISRSGLQTHERVHTGEKPYSCERCYKSFRTSSYLSKHRQKYCGREPCSKVDKQPSKLKPVKKPVNSRKLSKSKKTLKQVRRPPSKRNRVRRPQNSKQSKNTCTLASLPDSNLYKTREGDGDVKTEENSLSSCENGKNEITSTNVSAIETCEETLAVACFQEKTLHPSAGIISDGSKSVLPETQALTVPCEHISSAMKVPDIKVEDHIFVQDSTCVEENKTVVPYDGLIGNEDVLNVSCLQEENLPEAEPLKQEYKEVNPCNKSQFRLTDSQPQALQQDLFTKTQHQMIENYFKEINGPGFSEGAYQGEIDNPSLMDVQQVCEGFPQLATEASDVSQQACVVKGNSALLYSRGFI